MPRRSNPFQGLVATIQFALHFKEAFVQESAMVYNKEIEDENEIDILITYVKEAPPFSIGIECEDRGRKAGALWIRDVACKRDGCDLKKIIAIHSLGFTKKAIAQAANRNVTLMTFADISRQPDQGVKMLQKVLLPVGRDAAEHDATTVAIHPFKIQGKDARMMRIETNGKARAVIESPVYFDTITIDYTTLGSSEKKRSTFKGKSVDGLGNPVSRYRFGILPTLEIDAETSTAALNRIPLPNFKYVYQGKDRVELDAMEMLNRHMRRQGPPSKLPLNMIGKQGFTFKPLKKKPLWLKVGDEFLPIKRIRGEVVYRKMPD